MRSSSLLSAAKFQDFRPLASSMEAACLSTTNAGKSWRQDNTIDPAQPLVLFQLFAAVVVNGHVLSIVVAQV